MVLNQGVLVGDVRRSNVFLDQAVAKAIQIQTTSNVVEG